MLSVYFTGPTCLVSVVKWISKASSSRQFSSIDPSSQSLELESAGVGEVGASAEFVGIMFVILFTTPDKVLTKACYQVSTLHLYNNLNTNTLCK